LKSYILLLNYRKDNRTKNQFADDIIECTKIERELMNIYVDDLNKRKGAYIYTFVDNGIDNSGKLIENDKEITTSADFKLKKIKGRDRLIEIKFCRKDLNVFHLKTSQLKSYIRQDCCVVMFMGIDTENIRYTILKPSDMEAVLLGYKDVFFWGKKQKRLPIKDFNWYYVNINRKSTN